MDSSQPKTSAQTRQSLIVGGADELLRAHFTRELTAPVGSFSTYRRIRSNPTVGLARAVHKAPIVAAGWSVKAEDDASDDAVSLCQSLINRFKIQFLKDALQACDYGFKPFELVWDIGIDGLFPIRIKPLSVDNTRPLLDDHGRIIGLENFDTKLYGHECVWLSLDGEDDDPYGRSRFENIRTTSWWGWEQTLRQQLIYVTKVANPIPMIEYPPGVSKDASGTEISNYKIAVGLANRLGDGKPIIMPNTLAAMARDLLDRGLPSDKLRAWAINFAQVAAAKGGEFVSILRHYESGMMRGLLTPERSAIEGQYGTKADATAHGDLAISIAQETLNDIIQVFNEQVVNPVLLLNLGPQAVNTVRVEAAKLADAVYDIVKQVVVKALESNPALLEAWLDVDAAVDMLNLPKSEETIEPASAVARIINAA